MIADTENIIAIRSILNDFDDLEECTISPLKQVLAITVWYCPVLSLIRVNFSFKYMRVTKLIVFSLMMAFVECERGFYEFRIENWR